MDAAELVDATSDALAALVPETLDVVARAPQGLRRGLRQAYVSHADQSGSLVAKGGPWQVTHTVSVLIAWPVTGGATRADLDEQAINAAMDKVVGVLSGPSYTDVAWGVGAISARELSFEAQLRFALPLSAAGSAIAREVRVELVEMAEAAQ